MAKKKSSNELDVDALIANENIINSDVSEEMESSYLTYSIKTIIDRAIPDVRDGLKPVHRRILFGAYEGGYLPTKPYVKNAKIVGDVMGNFHPHGDGSIYEALVGMSQPWNYRYPLIDFHGNNGSYDGDGAAAYRYTEGKLDKKSLILLQDIDNQCVNFKSNYSETLMEPEALPGLFPNLLLNGASGIATGYTTEIPSHQLGEVIDGIIEVIKNPKIEVSEIMKHIKGPDFANGSYLINNSAIQELYETGKGSLTFKAKYIIEQNGESSNTQIIFTELPPDTNKPKLVEKIHEICLVKKLIPRVNDVRDESEENGTRIVIELHKTAIPDIIINELYEKTQLQKNCSYIIRAIVNNTPKVLSLKDIIEYYIEHRRDVIGRRTQFILNKTKMKLHIQEGLKLVTDDIDKAIEIIKGADTTDDAKKALINYFKLSEDQATEVLEIKLRQLTKLNKKDIDNLIKQLEDEIKKLENILSASVEIDKVIINELKQLKKDFNDERRTEIIGEDVAKQLDTVSENNEPIVLVLTSKNTIKHITLKALDDMFKNGTLKERTDTFIQGIKCQMNNQFVVIFTNGEYAKIEFSDLMTNLSFIDEKLQIKAIVVYDENDKDKTIITMSRLGIVKKVKMDGLKARLRRVAPLLQLQDDDNIIDVRVINMNDDNVITLATKDGLVHRFFEKSFKETAAGGKGINGISLNNDNEVIGFDVTNQNEDDKYKIVLFTKFKDDTCGMKSMALSEFKPKGRIAQGVKGIEFTKKLTGEVSKLVVCNNDFFTLDKKGNVTTQKYVQLPEHNRYNKPEQIQYEVDVTKFFLE